MFGQKQTEQLVFQEANFRHAPQDVNEMAYKRFVRPILEYASPVWDPHGLVVQEELEEVQNRAATFMTGTTV